MRSIEVIAAVFLASLALFISGCGGGGGGGGDNSGGHCSSVHVNTSSLQFSAYQSGTLPDSRSVVLTVDVNPPYIAGVAWASASDQVSWLDISSLNSYNPFSFNFAVNTTDFLPATYTTKVLVGITDSGGNAIDYCSLPISYEVKSPMVVTANPSAFNLSSAPYTQVSDSVTLSASHTNVSWSSSITYVSGAPDWLSLSQTSGQTLPQNITLNANGMPAGTYTARIEFNVGGVTQSVPVTLVSTLDQVTYVAPYIATEGISGEVVIRGNGFFNLTTPHVLFGSTMATSLSVVSNTEIRASYPALTAGSYPVIVGGTSNLPTRANLVVVPTPAYSYSTIDRPSGASHGIASGNIIYDAERQALFVCDINLNVTTSTYFDRVERYRFDGMSWTADLPLTFGAPHNLNSRIALSPDGDVLLKSGYNSMTHIDPVSLTVTANISPQLTFESAATLNLLAMSNDGTALGDAFPQFRDPVYYRYNILDQAFYPVAIPGGFTELGNRLLRATGDGSRIMAASFASTVTKEPLFFYGATDIDFVQAPIETTYTQKLALDRTGSRAAIQDGAAVTVYDSAFTALGEVAKPSSMVVSPDGSALYTYSSSDNTLRKYDLTSTDGMGGFNQTGSILLADQPSDNGNTDMTISPDGGTLFLVGNLRVIVTPVP